MAMMKAATVALADLAKQPVTEQVKQAYPAGTHLEFGPNAIIPKPLDERLLATISDAVTQAALESGA